MARPNKKKPSKQPRPITRPVVHSQSFSFDLPVSNSNKTMTSTSTQNPATAMTSAVATSTIPELPFKQQSYSNFFAISSPSDPTAGEHQFLFQPFIEYGNFYTDVYQTITCQPEFRKKSIEELRQEWYESPSTTISSGQKLTGHPSMPLCVDGTVADIDTEEGVLYYFGGGFDRLIYAIDLNTGECWSIEALSISDGSRILSRAFAAITVIDQELYLIGGLTIQDGIGLTGFNPSIEVVQLKRPNKQIQVEDRSKNASEVKTTFRVLMPSFNGSGSGDCCFLGRGHSAIFNPSSNEIILVGGMDETNQPLGISILGLNPGKPGTSRSSLVSMNRNIPLPFHLGPIFSSTGALIKPPSCADSPGLAFSKRMTKKNQDNCSTSNPSLSSSTVTEGGSSGVSGLYVFGSGAEGVSRLNWWNFDSPYIKVGDRFSSIGLSKTPFPTNENIQRTVAYPFEPGLMTGGSDLVHRSGVQERLILVCWYKEPVLSPITSTENNRGFSPSATISSPNNNRNDDKLMIPFEVWELDYEKAEMKAIDFPKSFFDRWWVNEVTVARGELIAVGRKKGEERLSMVRRTKL